MCVCVCVCVSAPTLSQWEGDQECSNVASIPFELTECRWVMLLIRDTTLIMNNPKYNYVYSYGLSLLTL